MRDVANVHDANPPQTNVVTLNGAKGVLMSIYKTGSASTLDIIAGIKAKLPYVMQLAIVASITALSALGETINVMTLGGLALAVGILVDDATVTIENMNWHLEHGKPIEMAILDGAKQIVAPAAVSLLCICVAFVPMFGLGGVAGYLFRPLAEAVVFAMIASYVLSRTLVPTMAHFLLRNQTHGHGGEGEERKSRNPLVRFQQGFERGFEAIRQRYIGLLHLGLPQTSLVDRRVFGGRWAFVWACPFPRLELLPEPRFR
jgi:multidrug efflux pump subunit AcrB